MGATVKGGHAASFKPITVDLDEEDQLIVDMKQQGYNNEDIVVRLVEKGFTRYEPRSVACRWMRIRKKTQEYEERLLDEELTDWHIGEVSFLQTICSVLFLTDRCQDEMLQEAYEIADKKFEVELEKLEQKRWAWTAQEVNKRLLRQRFSARACRQRFEDIRDNKARCPPELDPDPEARALEREERMAAYKLRKGEEAKRAVAEAEEKKRNKKENTAERIAARQRKEAQDALRAQKQQEKKQYRQSIHDSVTLARQRKQDALDAARTERLYNVRKDKSFVRLHKQLQKEVDALNRKKEKNGGVTPEPFEAREPRSKYAYKNTADQIANEDISATEAAIIARAHQFVGVVESVGTVATQTMPISKPAASIINVSGSQQSASVADGFDEDPRSFCTIDELHNILRSRGMLLNRMKETKPVILSRLKNEDNTIGIQQLKELLTARNEDSSGTKAQLVRRLSIADAKTSRKYQSTRTNRPLDENGKRTKVKMPVKPAASKYSARYNARDVVIKDGVAVTNVKPSSTRKTARPKKTPVKPKDAAKTTSKRKSTSASKQFIPDDDNDDDDDQGGNEQHDLLHRPVEEDMQDIVSSLLFEG
jgi:hypothetical protein